jgi:hypothetical protein
MFKKIKKLATCEMWSVIHFLNAGNMKLAEIYRQLCEVYGEHAMSDSVVQRWVRHFNRSLPYAVHITPAVSVTLCRTTYIARGLQL